MSDIARLGKRLLINVLVAFAYSSEVFPLFNREVGMSWAVFVNLFFAGKLSPTLPVQKSTGA